MTVPSIESVGFCAHYSPQGDWAFDYALKLSKERSVQLNVFHFLTDPYDPGFAANTDLSREAKEQLTIEQEKKLRFYYDTRAGQYLQVGFRVCEENEWVELHRCLVRREFQVLIMGYLDENQPFGGKPIEEFAESFVCPVVLVGPSEQYQYYLNKPAVIIIDQLNLPLGSWRKLETITA